MRADRGSGTAEYVAMHRAAHQLLDVPAIFDDPFAVVMTDPRFARALLADPEPEQRCLAPGRRAFLAARSRYAEDRLALAIEQGCEQYVVLGAGFDTFCLRNVDKALRVFEIDHPATQAIKLARLREAGIGMPARTSFYAADFTRQSLGEILREAGVDHRQRTFVSWLGVAQYLPTETVRAALQDIGSFGSPVEIVFDYTLHYDLQSAAQRRVFDEWRSLADFGGEPFRSMFTPDEVIALCASAGFSAVTTESLEELNARYCAPAGNGLRIEGINQLAYAAVR
ncbi:class I SAM-dependent methyltransferase [Trinickia sp. Y13]|uniref:class I SAM-dependent methyltransferase n=1 Tax=Trinickia sp. Y13 TaxID=2917807 RepID=UPI00240631E4|nr:class I SAM-dependent methyltransferase [Trinickia sp. Y13]MDG0025524.1 class I SAM-dependent methyltransferase [Trinickia sp. Y13]